METTAIASAILTLLAGISIFLIVFSKKAGRKTRATFPPDSEHIADHLINVAKTIRSLETAY